MLPASIETLLCASILLGIICHYLCTRILPSSRSVLPPGPPQLPLLGNVHQISLEYQHKTFAEWARKYGDLICIHAFHRPILIVSSANVARELLEKRGGKYSDRPYSILANKLVFPKPILGFMPYDETCRRLRKYFLGALETKSAVEQYRPMQRAEIGRLLSDLTHNPKEFLSHIRRYNGALMMEITYGLPVSSADDEFMAFANGTVSALSTIGSAASTLVDFIPMLRHIPTWMPGAGFKRRALEVKDMWAEMTRIPFEKVRSAMALGTAKPSLTTFMLQEALRDSALAEDDEYIISNAASQMYGGGRPSFTLNALLTFFLAMTIHPEIVKKAQAELDLVVGNSRLPELSDRDSLPYIDCIVKEVLRWNPAAPLGLPHRLQEDDTYERYTLPAGSMIVTNIWAMGRDPSLYSEPDEFLPERFQEVDAEKAASQDPRKYVFGFGRRICPGRFLADSSIWLLAANLLATMDIRRARDSVGREVVPTPSFKSGLIRREHLEVEPFECDIRPRSERAMDLITERYAEVFTQDN
ncbi:hypothetical protein POSPLADRAFT_1153345 [Postia placenta MAD-698-R-SB12]|uniref:Cytochrome P450 n=1 Tax=Postia placenta MAD-698-R-SB12 TaxID=670580 RepID=A0A1X6MQM7_9APHY|nr:hypothetical protein POSPLADRAFT_1153345 [Postia placenta MAD-698-R-SB12]OSX58687.1 hypothetical protein POSPLADRAFT_1153345 [Postia placenta MAD-698-R-SB12]